MFTKHSTDTITIRRATEADGRALHRLAALDSAEVPAGELLVAEVDGQLRAALAPDAGAAIADPFEPTAELLDLLHLRATATRRGSETTRPWARSRTRRLRLRHAA